MSRRPRDRDHYRGILAPSSPPELNDDGLIRVTSEGRLFYAIIAGITSTLLGVGALFVTGIAVGFAGFGSGRGWEPVALMGLVGWLGGLAAVLAITRNVFLGQRLPIGSAVAACVAATVVIFAVGWGIGVGGLGMVLLVAAASAGATWLISRDRPRRP